jgi:hypothetical protein
MAKQIDKIRDTLFKPDSVVKSKTDDSVEMFYKLFANTPVTQKYLVF